MLRLLSKSDVLKAKASEKQRDVQEGMKVAKQVDNLREIKSQEEVALEKFRAETIKEINKQIVEVSNKKEALDKEVKLLEDRKSNALESLDGEWQKVSEASGLLLKREETVSQIEKEIEEKYKEAEVKLKSIGDDKIRIAGMKDQTTKNLGEADKTLQNARATFDAANKQKVEVERVVAEKTSELDSREVVILGREKHLIEWEKKNSDKEKELHSREIALKDQTEILLRNQEKYGRRK